ncbi:MAG TPA: hypothetical protein VFG54_12305 [Prolixibacteraceae bacterium]|nr:hypothetical protein [Prolixibacteraceae bacterium]
MNYVTHFRHPKQIMGDPYIRFYCGMQKHTKKEKYFVSENREEVTCNGCMARIDNPVKALKIYGDLHVCKRHISMRPLPYTRIHVSAQNCNSNLNTWSILLYDDSQLHQTTCQTPVLKEVARFILNFIENVMLKPKTQEIQP